jgi:hypothetical protein
MRKIGWREKGATSVRVELRWHTKPFLLGVCEEPVEGDPAHTEQTPMSCDPVFTGERKHGCRLFAPAPSEEEAARLDALRAECEDILANHIDGCSRYRQH